MDEQRRALLTASRALVALARLIRQSLHSGSGMEEARWTQLGLEVADTLLLHHWDHEAGGVIEEHATADLGGRMDVALEHGRRAALQVIGEIPAPHRPQPMGHAMGLDRLNPIARLMVKQMLFMDAAAHTRGCPS